MKIIFTMIVLLALCLAACAQSVVVSGGSGKFQSVGGDFGRTWISNLQAQSSKPAAQDTKENLWGWGTMPKGKTLVGGKLVDAPNATWLYNTSSNWLGDYYVDPYTSQPVYTKYAVFPDYSSQQTSQPLALDPWAI